MGISRDLEEMPVVDKRMSFGPPVGMGKGADSVSSSESAVRMLRVPDAQIDVSGLEKLRPFLWRTIPIAETTTSTTRLLRRRVSLMEGMLWMSPLMMWRLGYWVEREESLEGVRARTLTVCPAVRQFLRVERPVPPVAPKMAIVDMVEVEEDILSVMIWCDGGRFGCCVKGDWSVRSGSTLKYG